MNYVSTGLLTRIFLTAVFLGGVLPLAIGMSWVGVSDNAVWGYLLAVMTGMLTLGFLVSLPRFWRGYGRELRNILFPEYLSPYRPLPRRTDNDRNDEAQS